MHSPDTNDPVDSFTLELLRSGVTLSDLAADLIDAMPADAHPGQDPSEVVLGMISGTISGFLDETDPADVERATELISGALDRVLEHLQLALELRRRMDGEAGGRGGDEPEAWDHGLDDVEPEPLSGAETFASHSDASDAYDSLATELLDCGGVLSQVIARMVEQQRTTDGTEYVAIPEAAHALLRQVLTEVSERHSEEDAAAAAALVGEVTNVLTNEIFFVNPEWN